MDPRTVEPQRRRGRVGAMLLLAAAALAVTLATASQAAPADRWKRAATRGNPAGAAQFRPQRFGAARFNGQGAGTPRGNPELAGVNPNAAREFQRPGGGPAGAGPGESNRTNETNRQIANLPPRGGLNARPGPGGVGAANTFQRGQFNNRFAHASFANRFARGPGAGGFARGQLANRFGRPAFAARTQPLLRYPGIPRRALIGEAGFTGVPPAGETRFVNNGVMFHVGANVTPQQLNDVARRYGLETLGSQSFNLAGGTLVHFRINDGRPVADVIRALEAENLGVAQPNYVFRTLQDASTLAARSSRGDPSQYVVDQLRLVDVHRIAIGSNVPVAVIDSEIDGKHPELAGAVVEEYDTIGNHDKPHSHGTGMAGAIAAHRKLVGIAPGAHIMAIHAFSSEANDSAQATSEHILMGIDWAINHGARVINMSFAGPDDPMLQLALQKAHEKGIVLIAAAGNAGPKSPPLYPAADPNVIAVTAVDGNDKLLPQANQGAYIAVAAPGVDILEPAPNGTYQVTTGTSVAAAHVSGIAALLLEHDPTIDEATVREVLTSSAKNLGAPGRDDKFGWGLVDPYRALMALDLRAKVAQQMPKDSPKDASKDPSKTAAKVPTPAARPTSVGSGTAAVR